MNIEEINTKNAPEAIGPYSQGITAGSLIFISGQIPADPETSQIIPGGIIQQAHQVFANIQAVLHAANADFSDVIKTTVFIKDLEDFVKFNEIYASYFTRPYPARSCVQASRLPKDALLEIEVIALKK